MKCPTCGRYFVDPMPTYCGKCGQQLFQKAEKGLLPVQLHKMKFGISIRIGV